MATADASNENRKKPPWAWPSVQAATIAVFALLVASAANITVALNRALSDQHANWNAALNPIPFPDSVLVVGVDDATVRKFGRLRNWSRSRYAALLDKTAQAKVVGLDIIFTEPDERDRAGDAALVAAVKRNGKVIVPAFVYNEARPITNDTQVETSAFLARLPHTSSDALDIYPPLNPQTIEPPIPGLVKNADALCYATINADPDGVYRRPVIVQAIPETGGAHLIPHFTAAVASVATGKPLTDLLQTLPLTDGALSLHSIARRGGSLRERVGTPVPYISFADALEEKPETFKNKIVLVGDMVTGTADVRPNPIDNGLRGVELNAEIVTNMIGGVKPFTALPMLAGWVLILASVAVPIWFFSAARGIPTAVVGSTALLVCLVVVMEAAYWFDGSVPPWAEVLIGFTATTLVAGIQRAAEEATKRRQLQDSFSAYVAPEMVAELIEHPESLLAGMKRVRCAILFSDIRGFTSYSEQNPPDVVDRQMREYLTEMSSAVFARYHFLDKFVGDAVMALFGDLFPSKQKAGNFSAESVFCALDMLDRLDRLNTQWSSEGLPTFRIGIGLHEGEALFGNVGSAQRVQLTALGDSVNLAARLQTATKDYSVTILVSEAIKNEAEHSPLLTGRVQWKDLGAMTVRGRGRETRIFSVERLSKVMA